MGQPFGWRGRQILFRGGRPGWPPPTGAGADKQAAGWLCCCCTLFVREMYLPTFSVHRVDTGQ